MIARRRRATEGDVANNQAFRSGSAQPPRISKDAAPGAAEHASFTLAAALARAERKFADVLAHISDGAAHELERLFEPLWLAGHPHAPQIRLRSQEARLPALEPRRAIARAPDVFDGGDHQHGDASVVELGGRMGARIVIVSNRVAAPDAARTPAAGGLAVAVKAVLKGRDGLWFGWSGKIEEAQSEPRTIEVNKTTYALIDLQENDFQEYYNGLANRVLWPILHYRVDLQEYSRAEATGYMRVNRLFADKLSALLREDDIIWVHDYHLMPLGRELRARGHRNSIGFFLHIPCAPPDILQTLPYHREILGSLPYYDLVGFQTENDRDNFAHYLMSAGARAGRGDARGDAYEIDGQAVRLGVFPVSIETAVYMRLARNAARSPLAVKIRESLGGCRLVLGVDRLDYSKGIPQRVKAFETFLEANPQWHSKVTLLQITPKSRGEIKEYAEIEAEVTALIGKINGRFGDAAWTPIRYVNRSYSRTALAGIYAAADVAMATPLRDGMNLVAKEFLVAQDPGNPGVLLLSQFAGAAAALDNALIVNPHETEGMAAALKRALEMPLEERRQRHAPMIEYLREHDIKRWADDYLAALTDSRQRASLLNGLRALFGAAPEQSSAAR
jgi:trehalose 6-phosphate synthase